MATTTPAQPIASVVTGGLRISTVLWGTTTIEATIESDRALLFAARRGIEWCNGYYGGGVGGPPLGPEIERAARKNRVETIVCCL